MYGKEHHAENVDSKVVKSAIFNFDFDHNDFKELSHRYIADSEFHSK